MSILKFPLTAGALKWSLIGNLVLAVMVASSLAGNVAQWRASIVDSEQRAADLRVAAEKGRADALQYTLTTTSLVATMAVADNASLVTDLGALVDRGRTRMTVYRERVDALPPAACAPGQQRMDATNGVLRSDG